MNRRFIIVSYRLPFSIKKKDNTAEITPTSGGLVNAFKTIHSEGFSEKPIWVGCADFDVTTWNMQKKNIPSDFDFHPVFFDKKTNNNFYYGFSNSVLWPLFHYFPSYMEYQNRYFEAYKKANEEVCQKIISISKPGDQIWIQDYHFIPLAGYLREKLTDVKLGFFLHIPFPSYEIFRLLPKKCRELLLKGILGNDLIGFHTHEYVVHFLKTIQMVLGAENKHWNIFYEDRIIKADAFPVSIDFDLFHKSFDQPAVKKQRKELKAIYPTEKIIFSVDRLDYTKGVLNRLYAYEHFLNNYPDWKGKVVFILIVVPSRDEHQKYWERKQSIDQMVGRINGKLGTLNWSPIIYKYSSLSFEELTTLYTSSDVALITPIRDGMNLVAKEFVASRKDKKGVLILSEMAGASNELSEALQINPTDPEDIADRIQEALEMPVEEQTERIEKMQIRIQKYNVDRWVKEFLKSLEKPLELQTKKEVRFLDPDRKRDLLINYQNSRKRLFLFDYDGTLVDFSKKPELAVPSSSVKEMLEKIATNPNNTVMIISGRDANALEKFLGDLPVYLIAEHGSLMKKDSEWLSFSNQTNEWKHIIKPILEDFTDRCAKSFVEEKSFSIAWHYRNVDPDLGFQRSRELINTIDNLANDLQLRIIDGNKVVEIKNFDTDKGSVTRKVLGMDEYDFVLAAGDDRTDEDMFSVLQEPHHYSIKIGKDSNSLAQYSLHTVQQMHSLLQNLSIG